MRKIIILLSLLLIIGCAHQGPKRNYQWTSLSEKGLTANTVTVLKEDKTFENDKGFENLTIQKQPLTDAKFDRVEKIVFIGDTGCRLKESKYGESYQNCKDSKEWQYPEMAKKIANEKPDLIIHVGDYHYRENCSEGKVCRQYTDSIGYGWKSWEADFFAPSKVALTSAPWIFLRGNHEDCKRAYAGYKLLSEQTWKDTCAAIENTEYISIGDLLLVNIDTASISDHPETPENQLFWAQQFKDVEMKLNTLNAKHVWIITHKPFTGLVNDKKGWLDVANNNLREAFAKSNLQSKVDVIIAGHFHNTQILKADNFPKQIVVGNSGTALDESQALMDRQKILKNKIGGLKIKSFFSDTKSGHSFGYAVMTKTADGKNWQITLKDLEGNETHTEKIKDGQ